MKTIHLACLLALAPLAAVQAQPVKAPPLPPGSNMVQLEPGMNPDERKRQVRAHKHKGRHKKDYTRDDGPRGNDRDDRGNGKNDRGNDKNDRGGRK